MHEFLPTADDVIAFRCSGKLERAAMEAILDRIEASIARHEKTHMYAEVEDFSGFETEDFQELVKRSTKLLGKLDRLGRIAVVSDQAWIRWAAKLESAVLPHVSYETFESHERDRALAWVKGEEERPHGPAIRVIESNRPDVLGFELDGRATKAELDSVAAYFNGKLDAARDGHSMRMLGRIRNLGGFEMSGLMSADYFAMKRGFLDRLERYAVVGGPGWLKTMTNTLGPLFKTDVRWFEPERESEAWSWLGAEPVSERTLAS